MALFFGLKQIFLIYSKTVLSDLQCNPNITLILTLKKHSLKKDRPRVLLTPLSLVRLMKSSTFGLGLIIPTMPRIETHQP